MHENEQNNISFSFTKKAAYLGLVAYIVLIGIVLLVYQLK